MTHVDVAVVGGGIVGLATTLALIERLPGVSIAVLEKEGAVGAHQSGRSSGVLHSGLYYRPGSLKARLCVEGHARMLEFCRQHDLPAAVTGKVVVATDEAELPALDELERRGKANGVAGLARIDAEELGQIEPHAAGIAALHVPPAAVVDFRRVTLRLAELCATRGAAIRTGTRLLGARPENGRLRMTTSRGDVTAKLAVNCAGLHTDRVARLMGLQPPLRIVPFRGEYRRLRPERAHLVRSLIYPVPDPRFPFLGIHLTRGVDGAVEVGPNAVLAFAREGYHWGRVAPRDVWETVAYGGFRSLAARYWRTGLGELVRSLSRRAFLHAARRLVPELRRSDLRRSPAGVRAQAVTSTGELVDDFVIIESGSAVHVLNAPSPAATASLAIGEHLAEIVGSRL